MGKRKGRGSGEEIVKKKPRRLIIYSSDEDSNSSVSSDRDAEPGPSRDVVADVHVDAPPASAVTENPNPAPSTVEEAEIDLDEALLQLLGEAPEPDTTLGKPIHKDVASRWVEILKKGLTKEVREKLEKEYLVPANCELLVPPILNPEAKAALTEIFVKRDASLTYRQKQTSNAVAALAQAIDVIISHKGDQELKQKILKPVSDACRILCDMHHSETKLRKKFVISSINTGMKETLINSSTDKYLFGKGMSEKLKAAKTVQRSGESLKAPQKSVFHKSNFYKQNIASKNKSNFRPLHQKTAGKQDAGKTSSAPRHQSSSTPYRRARDRSPPPPPPRRTSRR